MAAVAASVLRTELLVKDEPCCLAAINGPERCVVSGPIEDIERVIARARALGIAATLLPVSHAFHSPAMEPCVAEFSEVADTMEFGSLGAVVYSTVTGDLLEPECDLGGHLVRQLTQPVRFAEALERLADHVDLLIELGPGRMLTTLAGELTSVPAIAIDGAQGGCRNLLASAGAAFALGARLRADKIFAGRATKPFDESRPGRFFESPCGLGDARGADDDVDRDGTDVDPAQAVGEGGALEVVTALAAARCELPVAALSPDDRFLSDLHLTSIAVSELASRAARALARPPLVAPNEFADATLRDLADAIDSDERILSSNAAAGVDAWVRAFEVAYVERSLPRSASREVRARGRWKAFAPEQAAHARSLAEALERAVGGEGVLVYLAPDAGEAGIEPLLAAAREAIAGFEARYFVLVHHGDPAASVARTLHQEARSLSTRVIELEPDERPDPEMIAAEVRAASAYAEVRYVGGSRFERSLRVLPPARGEGGSLPLGHDDVLLVTGGGKGIAAECAHSLARRTGCALAIVGRSDPQHDDALRDGLARLSAAGVRHAYARADLGDAAQTLRAIDALEAELGLVSGLLHGAGVNEPCALSTLERSLLDTTLAPKLGGLRTLLGRVDASRLRCAIVFGSLIAEIGLPGEAHYGYANEAMTRELERYAAENPSVRCLSVEWSVWSGIGMGDRLGRIEILAAQNITAISPEEGCLWLERLLSRDDMPVRTVVTGRFGSPVTLRADAERLQIGRFLERTREYTPDVELVVEAQLSHESDPWLADHIYGGEPIVPGVVGLEAMTQVASALAGTDALPRFDDVRFLLPIVVPAGEKCRVRIAALVREPGRIELAVRASSTDFATDHMSASLSFDCDAIAAGEAPAIARCAPRIPADAFYGDVFFHGGRFRRVRDYEALHWNGCRAHIEASDAPLFGGFQPQGLRLGDACARDAAVHAVQACLPEVDVLPTSVERIEILAPLRAGPVCLEARERQRDADRYVYDLAIFAGDGSLVERWSGLVLERVTSNEPRTRWPPALLAPRLEELATDALPSFGLRAACVPGIERDATGRALSLALGRDATLRYRADGRPEVDGAFVSASHAAGHTLGVTGRQPIACDIEVVSERAGPMWRDLLGDAGFAVAERLAATQAEPFDLAATRVWCALECIRKLGALRETPLLVASESSDPPGVARLSAGGHVALTFAATLSDGVPVVATLLGNPDA